ncbi:MAG TPA: PilZ domain-containing protein [Polyangiales bacterium]
MQHARKSNRAPVPLEPRYRSASSFEYVDGRCIDLSEGGMFIAADLPADQGTLIKFECAVDGKAGALKGVGRVVWRRTGAGPDRPSGMGLKFVKLEPGSPEVIAQLVSDAQARGTTAPEAPLQTQVRRTDSFPAQDPAVGLGLLAIASEPAVAATELPNPPLLAAAPESAGSSAAQSAPLVTETVPAATSAELASAPVQGSAPQVAAPHRIAAADPVAAIPKGAPAQQPSASGGGGAAVWVALAAGAALLLWLLLR